MRRLSPSVCLLAAILIALPTPAQDVTNSPQGQQIPGPTCSAFAEWPAKIRPCSADEHAAWLEDIRHWRDERKARVGADASQYTRPELQWTQSSFIQPQMMVHDRFFYDPASARYTTDTYLNDLKFRYGGIDSVLLWHTYPNLGIDDRNQYDMFRDLPGGTAGVRAVVDAFHRGGVKVLFPLMVWDRGTRPEGESDASALSKQLAAVGADGINGDTLGGLPLSFRTASDALGHPLALQPEAGVDSDEMLNYNNLSWGYWNYTFTPSVSRYKWLETRHLVNLCNRWGHTHLDDLQSAFFNGTGFETWENVWGIWNQMTPRDAETVRRIATIERASSDLLVSPAWEPHVPTLHFGVFASKWPGSSRTLWTIVNRNHYAVTGDQIRLPRKDGARYFDLWHGVELHPMVSADHVELSFPMAPDGYGAILETAGPNPHDLQLLATMKTLAAQPLASFSTQWKTLPQTIVPIPPSKPTDVAPAGMVRIPAGDFNFRVNGIEIEGTNDEGVDVQYPGEPSPRRYHDTLLHLASFWIDTFEVTNAAFKKFLGSTHYLPPDTHNFLRDWQAGSYPAGWANKPVTWVSLEDARAYARWAGKRLPHEWEWQYAAQGTDGRRYPWGEDAASPAGAPTPSGSSTPAARIPTPDTARRMLPPADVDAHPAGASPFGVQDLVGNVWQWTDEFTDAHTRAAILRGGSHYQPQGSRWYFPQAYLLSEHGKYLLMAPALDRSGAVGFRCVQDAR